MPQGTTLYDSELIALVGSCAMKFRGFARKRLENAQSFHITPICDESSRANYFNSSVLGTRYLPHLAREFREFKSNTRFTGIDELRAALDNSLGKTLVCRNPSLLNELLDRACPGKYVVHALKFRSIWIRRNSCLRPANVHGRRFCPGFTI